MMEMSIDDFQTSFYITEIQNIAFYLLHVCIIGTNLCGNTLRKAFKCRSAKQYVLYRRYYAEILVASFAHQIQSVYYAGNIYFSIKGISLEYFSSQTHTETAIAPQECTRHSLFHSFCSDDRK